VFPIRVPPLRERTEDLALLVRHFVNRYSRQMNKQVDIIPAETIQFLRRHTWPGNIRELQNFTERAVILSPGKVLSAPLHELRLPGSRASGSNSNGAKATTLEECERKRILEALNETRWIVGGPNGAASLLDVKRTTLIGKMQKLGIARRSRAGESAP
jgi:DNA-binding NtrC family response regulator